MRDSNDTITVLGVIGTDPESKTTQGGVPVITFRMASTQRKFDKAANKWVDGSTNWYTVSGFRMLAENALATLHKGDPVIVTGRLHLRAWDTGEKRGVSADLEADVIGLDLQWGTATYQRTVRTLPTSGAARAAAPAQQEGELWATPGLERPGAALAGPGNNDAGGDGADGAHAQGGDGEAAGAQEGREALDVPF